MWECNFTHPCNIEVQDNAPKENAPHNAPWWGTDLIVTVIGNNLFKQ